MPDVVTLGECMAVLYPSDPVSLDEAHSLLLDIGGAEANLAIAMCRLGHSARFISRVGDDPFGRRVRAVLSREGVDTSSLLTDPHAPTGVFFREWLADGARRVYYYRHNSAARRITPDDLTPEQFNDAQIVHLTGITPALSTSCADACMRAIDLARTTGALISFDPNFRPRLWSASQARETLIPMMRAADILLIGHEDAHALLEVSRDDDALAAAAALGARIVILKRAEHGAVALISGQRFVVPAVPVARVIDPVGAGDGFDAGFLAGWLRGWSIPDSLALGARIGAAAVEHLGDYAGYPRL